MTVGDLIVFHHSPVYPDAPPRLQESLKINALPTYQSFIPVALARILAIFELRLERARCRKSRVR